MATSSVTLTDGLKVVQTSNTAGRRAITLQEHLVVANAIGRAFSTSVTLRSALKLASHFGGASSFSLTLRSTLKLQTTRISAGTAALLRSTLRLHHSGKTAQATRIHDTLRLALHAHLVAEYRLALRSILKLAPFGPHYGLAAYLHSTLNLHASITRGYVATARLASALHLHATLGRQLVIVATHADTLDLSGELLLKGIYEGALFDTVDFVMDVIDPGGDVTTWAMNARTGAVTEYTGYGFSAFAKSSAGLYLGATSSGLYELAGPDDAGEPVIADIISGLSDFGGSFFSGFKAAYLAVRGSGQFFLKLTSGDGRVHVYGVNAKSLQTSRINVGKGLRSRYYTYELVSVGQDFDLTSLTFLPIQATRRV